MEAEGLDGFRGNGVAMGRLGNATRLEPATLLRPGTAAPRRLLLTAGFG